MRDRWNALCARVGAFGKPEEADLTFETLSTLYTHPPRAYHNLDHIRACLQTFDCVRLLAEHRDAVEFALWLHDCVFIPERPDNESRSADAAGMIAGLLGCVPAFVARVRGLIAATRHASPPPPGDPALVADIDLADLAAPPADYDRYRRAIREEFAFADDAMFRAGRSAFLHRMLDRPSIFSTPLFLKHHEPTAHANLRRELDALLDMQPDMQPDRQEGPS